MLVKIKRQELDALPDESLIWACIEPAIQQIRGKSFLIKSEVSSHLTAGQRALLMFQMLYGHTMNGVAEFYSHLSYLLKNKGVWYELKNGMRYFGDDAMFRLVCEMEDVYNTCKEKNGKEDSEEFDVINTDKGSALRMTIGRLDTCLYEILPATIKSVGAYIRKNPGEFVQIEE